MIKRLFYVSILLSILSANAFGEMFFSGFAGAKFDFQSDKESDSYDPEGSFHSFFAGQMNLSKDCIVHGEFSLKTESLSGGDFYKKTPAEFQIDELSITFRKPLLASTNYLSFFTGTYEPIGSDIFLRRQFGIKPICSKLLEGWLGLAGSVIYPMFGVGGSEIIHFDSQPIASGIYIYINREIEDSYILNGDFRWACVYRFFTLDVDAGVGVPLVEDKRDEAYFVIDSIYGRTGINMLIGNSYTTSFFVQAGFTEIPFKKKNESVTFDENKAYFLFEPRFRNNKCSFELTAFSLPKETVQEMLFLDETLGINFNTYTDNLYIKTRPFTFGLHSTLAFKDKHYNDLKDFSSLFDDYQITASPYIETRLGNGILHSMMKLKITDMIEDSWYKAVKLSIGYKAQF